METRSKRKQQEREAAAIAAPVETRAQKAARTVDTNQAPALELTSGRKRKQQLPQETDTRLPKRHLRAEQRESTRASDTGRIQQLVNKKAPTPDEAKDLDSSTARLDQLVQGMDRHRRDARKGLEEAAREAEQVRE